MGDVFNTSWENFKFCLWTLMITSNVSVAICQSATCQFLAFGKMSNVSTLNVYGNLLVHIALADLEAACRAHAPPSHGTQFFSFGIHFCQKAPVSEVHAPPNGSTPPYGKSWIRHCIGRGISLSHHN